MDALIRFLETPSVPLAALIVFLEQIGLPVPAMPALVASGAFARDGRLSGPLLLLAALVCTMVADAMWYVLGWRYGGRAIRLIGKVALSRDARAKAESMIGKFRATTLLFAKFVPGLSVISVPLAGASNMPLGTFFLYDGMGALIWAGTGMTLGAIFHHEVEHVLATLTFLSRGGVAVLAAAAVVYVVWHLVQRRRVPEFVLKRISPDEIAARLSTDGAPRVFDARSVRTRHLDGRAVPGSRPLRVGELAEDLEGVPKDQEIVLYCGSPSQDTAIRVAHLLRANGFANVQLLEGGLDGWAAAGHPLQRLPGAPAAEGTETTSAMSRKTTARAARTRS